MLPGPRSWSASARHPPRPRLVTQPRPTPNPAAPSFGSLGDPLSKSFTGSQETIVYSLNPTFAGGHEDGLSAAGTRLSRPPRARIAPAPSTPARLAPAPATLLARALSVSKPPSPPSSLRGPLLARGKRCSVACGAARSEMLAVGEGCWWRPAAGTPAVDTPATAAARPLGRPSPHSPHTL